jgi:hypothetical protein
MPAMPKPQPPPKSGETVRPMNAKEVSDKVEHDLRRAADAGIRVTKTVIKIALEPKIETAKRILKAIFNEE